MRGWLVVALILTGSLIAINGLRQFFVEPLTTPTVNALWFLVQIAPLLAVLPGMLRLHAGSTFAAVLVSLLYFVHGVLLAATPELRVMGIAEAIIAVALVCVATYLTRTVRSL